MIKPFYTKSLDTKNQDEIQQSCFSIFNSKSTNWNNERFQWKRKSVVDWISHSELKEEHHKRFGIFILNEQNLIFKFQADQIVNKANYL